MGGSRVYRRVGVGNMNWMMNEKRIGPDEYGDCERGFEIMM